MTTRRHRRIIRAARRLQGVPYCWGPGDGMDHSALPPSHADPNIVGNAEGNRRLREQDRAAIRARLKQEQNRDMGERDR